MGNKPRPVRESGARMMTCAELDHSSGIVYCSTAVYSTERFIRFKTYTLEPGGLPEKESVVKAISDALHLMRVDVPYLAFVYSPTLGFHDRNMMLYDLESMELDSDVKAKALKRFKFYGVPNSMNNISIRGGNVKKHYAIRDLLYESNASLMSGNLKAAEGITSRLRTICSTWSTTRYNAIKLASYEADKIMARNHVYIDSTRCLYAIVWEGPTGSKVSFASQDRKLVEEEYKRLLQWFDVTGKGFKGVLKWLDDHNHLVNTGNIVYLSRQFGIENQAVKEFCRLSRNGKYTRFHMDVIPYITSKKDGKDKEVFLNIEEETDASRTRFRYNGKKDL